jgi:hypothetical protein
MLGPPNATLATLFDRIDCEVSLATYSRRFDLEFRAATGLAFDGLSCRPALDLGEKTFRTAATIVDF